MNRRIVKGKPSLSETITKNKTMKTSEIYAELEDKLRESEKSVRSVRNLIETVDHLEFRIEQLEMCLAICLKRINPISLNIIYNQTDIQQAKNILSEKSIIIAGSELTIE